MYNLHYSSLYILLPKLNRRFPPSCSFSTVNRTPDRPHPHVFERARIPNWDHCLDGKYLYTLFYFTHNFRILSAVSDIHIPSFHLFYFCTNWSPTSSSRHPPARFLPFSPIGDIRPIIFFIRSFLPTLLSPCGSSCVVPLLGSLSPFSQLSSFREIFSDWLAPVVYFC